MLYSKELFDEVQGIIDERRRVAENRLNERMLAFEAMEPRYREIKAELIDSVRAALESVNLAPQEAEANLIKQRGRNLSAQRELKNLLAAHGLPEDYLSTAYTCKKCGDTGAVGTELCTCFTELLRKRAFEEANNNSPLRFCTFGDFRLDYYSDAYDEKFKCSPRERMQDIVNYCKAYAENFEPETHSLLLTGETGLGKTHLSLAIAGEVIKKGYKVLYNSAQNIFGELQKEYFGKGENRGQFESLVLECDLLILDDLGAEFSTQFTDAALYNIINTRINKRLPTIISTNILIENMESRYSQRISSRLIGEYVNLRFLGGDIRQLKADT